MDKERVLVVDDEIDFLGLMKMVLEDCGIEVMVAESGPEAFNLLQENQGMVDAIFLDINMPIMNGVEVARKLRESEMTRDVYIEFVTVWSEEMLKKKFAGVEKLYNGYLEKPLDVESLCRLAETIIEKHRKKT